MTFTAPAWLLLLVPLGAFLALQRPARGRPALFEILRALLCLAVVLALAGPALVLPSRDGVLVLVADRSASMPEDAARAASEAASLLARSAPAGASLGVVSFGSEAVVDAPPGRPFRTFETSVAPDASNLAGALEKALALVPEGVPGRILVLSDGRATGRDPLSLVPRALSRGIAVDARVHARPTAHDLAIESVDVPEEVAPSEAFVLSALVRAPEPQTVAYTLARGHTILAKGTRSVPQGLTRLSFRDRADAPGTAAYTLTVTGEGADPLPGNGTARALVGIRGRRPVLHIGPSGSGLSALLARARISHESVTPENAPSSLEALSGFSGVLLENVPASKLPGGTLATIAPFVTERGAGLLTTGGRTAYGPGGWFKSPIDPLLPVSMELRQEHRKLALAIVVALDRSGSMAVSAGGGRTKMDLANLGTVEVLSLLSAMDELGVIAVDSSAHTVVPLGTADPAMKSRILSIESMGGGIFVFEALAAAADMIKGAKAQTRHIILFADAADAEEPGAYADLLFHCRDAGITVSVIGLGTPRDSDAELLKDVARRGGGNVYFTNDPGSLPALFAEDTFVVARSAFVEDVTPFAFTPGLLALTGRPFGTPPPVGGYDLTYLREGASLDAITKDEYAAPLVAHWTAGAGRVVSVTAEASGKDSGPFAAWKDAPELWASLARWASGDRDALPEGLLLERRVVNGAGELTLHATEAAADALGGTPEAIVLSGVPGQAPRVTRIAMERAAPDLFRAVFPLHGEDVALPTVELPGGARHTLAPLVLPYPAELVPETENRGPELLRRLARATGGVERVALDAAWKDLPRAPRTTSLAPALLLLAAGLLVVEVLERRTSIVGALLARIPGLAFRPRPRVAPSAAPSVPARGATPDLADATRAARTAAGISTGKETATATAAGSSSEAASGSSGQQPTAPDAAPGTTVPGSLVDALAKARKAARSRDDVS